MSSRCSVHLYNIKLAWEGVYQACLCIAFFIPPNFKEVEGAYWFGSVRQVSRVQASRVCELRLALGQEPLELGSLNLVCGLYMKIKRTHVFSFR